MDVVEWDGESFLVDSWQRAIVMKANTECPGFDGNYSGDDVAKERGLKYVVTGQCDSHLIQIYFSLQECCSPIILFLIASIRLEIP